MFLLKNNNTLPLAKGTKVAIIGPNADNAEAQWGNYNGFPSKTITILDGIKNKVGEANVVYIQGCEHVGNTTLEETFLKWNGTFWNNTVFLGQPAATLKDSEVKFVGGTDYQFVPNVRVYDYSARFTTVYRSTKVEQLEISIKNDGNAKFFIDGQLNLTAEYDEDGTQVFLLNASVKNYSFTLDYVHRKGQTKCSFSIGVRRNVNVSAILEKTINSSVIIFVGGLWARLEGEEMPVTISGFDGGDRNDLELPQIQKDILRQLKATGKKVVFVFCTGSALAINWEQDNLDAILNAWYGGQNSGAAVADVLFGDYNPAGRLPITFYKSEKQLSDFSDYNMVNRTYRYMIDQPLYPFGYGLSYSTFTYSNAKLSSTEIGKDQDVSFTVDVKNNGQIDGDEVVQVYVSYPEHPKEPIKSLKGFKRVNIKAGQVLSVSIDLTSRSFETFSDVDQIMGTRSGRYIISYGSSSSDNSHPGLEIRISSE